MLMLGQVVEVYQGREYNGRVPDVVQILDRTGTGRKVLHDITLAPDAVTAVKGAAGRDVLLDYTELTGTSQNGRWRMMVDGRLADAEIVSRLAKATSSATVSVGAGR